MFPDLLLWKNLPIGLQTPVLWAVYLNVEAMLITLTKGTPLCECMCSVCMCVCVYERQTDGEVLGPVKSHASIPQTCFSSQWHYFPKTVSHLNHTLLVSCRNQMENGGF